jgi:hypothetical protein
MASLRLTKWVQFSREQMQSSKMARQSSYSIIGCQTDWFKAQCFWFNMGGCVVTIAEKRK